MINPNHSVQPCGRDACSMNPPLCPPVFQCVAEAVLRATTGLSTQDISHSNCCNVYVQLVVNFEWLFTSGFL